MDRSAALATLLGLFGGMIFLLGAGPPAEPDMSLDRLPDVSLPDLPAAPNPKAKGEPAKPAPPGKDAPKPQQPAVREDTPAAGQNAPLPPAGAWPLEKELEVQFADLKGQIANRALFERVAAQTYRQESLILPEDRDPADVVFRRTAALLADLKRLPDAPELSGAETELDRLRTRGRQTDPADAAARYELYLAACRVRRTVAFANPLLKFDSILCIKKHPSGASHMCDQYFGKNAATGGGLFVLSDPFGPQPRLRDVLEESVVASGRLKDQKLAGGCFLSPDICYDAREVVFAYTQRAGGGWSPESSFHVFKVDVDGSNLLQLTDGPENDFDPCFLPNGRICFNSERRGGFGRCHGRPVPTYTLHWMNPDGSDIAPISLHETNEWHPSVNNDGMIVYSRWDYVDRDSNTAHHPWVTSPDGRDARSIHGNFPIPPNGRGWRPWMELDVKAIPGSRRYVATAAPHHGQAFGSLVMVDGDLEDDDAMSQVRRITPEAPFPEAEGGRWAFATSWPLSEDYYLCVYAPAGKAAAGKGARGGNAANHGIYLVDSFGNREMIYRDPSISCQSPMPLTARPRPATVVQLCNPAPLTPPQARPQAHPQARAPTVSAAVAAQAPPVSQAAAAQAQVVSAPVAARGQAVSQAAAARAPTVSAAVAARAQVVSAPVAAQGQAAPAGVAGRALPAERAPGVYYSLAVAPAQQAEEPRPADPGPPPTETIACINVYDGLKPWPEGTRIAALRIVQLFPKATPSLGTPRIGVGAQALARGVLGTVPVEADGSAYFHAPPNKPIYFQAVDDRGLAVQSMRSLTYIHPGERLTCQGCHERRHRAPQAPASVPLALRRAPSTIQPDVDGSNPLLFPRLVQPALDRNCVPCHSKNPAAPDLSGQVAVGSRSGGWSNSYVALSRHAYWLTGGNGGIRTGVHGGSRSTPGEVGALAAPLFQMLQKGHHGLKLPAEDLRRITLWLDANSNFFGAYLDTEAQALGKAVTPTIE